MSGWGAILNNTHMALRSHALTLARLQEQAATGARIIRPSDSPADAGRIIHLKNQHHSLSTYLGNLNVVTLGLEQTYGVMQETSAHLTQVAQLVSQATGAIYSAENRVAIASEIDSILEQILTLGNTRSLGRYLMGGAGQPTPPFVAERVEGKITSVRYVGGGRQLLVPVAPGVEYPALLSGKDVLMSPSPAGAVVLGATGAAAGSRPSSVIGEVQLAVAHEQTTFIGDAKGIQAVSGAADTLLGNHRIVLDVPGRTIAVEGGPAVSFDGSEAALALTGPQGQVVHLDMRGLDVDGDFAGDLQLRCTARVSIDGSATSTVISDFSQTNVAVADSITGRVLYVDATGIVQAGADVVRVSPTAHDTFAMLINLRDAMMNDAGLSDQQQRQLLADCQQHLERAMGGLTQQMAAVGGRLQAMDSLRQSLETLSYDANDHAALLQDADIVEVATELARFQTLYEMTLATSSRLLSLSLLDYI